MSVYVCFILLAVCVTLQFFVSNGHHDELEELKHRIEEIKKAKDILAKRKLTFKIKEIDNKIERAIAAFDTSESTLDKDMQEQLKKTYFAKTKNDKQKIEIEGAKMTLSRLEKKKEERIKHITRTEDDTLLLDERDKAINKTGCDAYLRSGNVVDPDKVFYQYRLYGLEASLSDEKLKEEQEKWLLHKKTQYLENIPEEQRYIIKKHSSDLKAIGNETNIYQDSFKLSDDLYAVRSAVKNKISEIKELDSEMKAVKDLYMSLYKDHRKC